MKLALLNALILISSIAKCQMIDPDLIGYNHYNGFDSLSSVGTNDIKLSPIHNQGDKNYIGVSVAKYKISTYYPDKLNVNFHFKISQNTSMNYRNSSVQILMEDGEILKYKYCKCSNGGDYKADLITSIPFEIPFDKQFNKTITAIRIITGSYHVDYYIEPKYSDVFTKAINTVRITPFKK